MWIDIKMLYNKCMYRWMDNKNVWCSKKKRSYWLNGRHYRNEAPHKRLFIVKTSITITSNVITSTATTHCMSGECLGCSLNLLIFSREVIFDIYFYMFVYWAIVTVRWSIKELVQQVKMHVFFKMVFPWLGINTCYK